MKESKEQGAEEQMSLSSALLAPINSIFEAQIHAGRAFLNFILQMGFKDKEHPEEHEELTKLKQRKETEDLSEEEVKRLKALHAEHGEMYYQFFDFIDDTGNASRVSVPNLALLPVKPLAITEASFSYQFAVESQSKKYRQMGTEKSHFNPEGDEPSRPWYLVSDPRSLRGSFCEQTENSNARSIKVNIKVGSADLPYGLEKLMVHLTNSIDVVDNEGGDQKET